MSQGLVTSEIATLDQLSRSRALTDAESRRLQKLITVDRRYTYSRRARVAAPAATAPDDTQSRSIAPPLILRRLDAVLQVMEAESLAVRAIYLARVDLEAFLGTQEKIARPVGYRGHEVRAITGKGSSCVYSTHGVSRAVPRAA